MPDLLTPLQDGPVVHIPAWVVDNASFLRWAESPEAPERGKFGFFQGKLWVDLTMELVLHNLIKTQIAHAVMSWAEARELGQYYGDGLLVSCPKVELSSEPDGIFVRTTTAKAGKVRFKKGLRSRVLYGVPDMVLEVVSRSSARKDLVTLKQLYHEAGITEYWIVDSRKEEPRLQVYRRTPSGYAASPTRGGWVQSVVLGGRFRLDVDHERNVVRLEAAEK